MQKKFDIDLGATSWNYEEGVLLSANEAIEILTYLKRLDNDKG